MVVTDGWPLGAKPYPRQALYAAESGGTDRTQSSLPESGESKQQPALSALECMERGMARRSPTDGLFVSRASRKGTLGGVAVWAANWPQGPSGAPLAPSCSARWAPLRIIHVAEGAAAGVASL